MCRRLAHLGLQLQQGPIARPLAVANAVQRPLVDHVSNVIGRRPCPKVRYEWLSEVSRRKDVRTQA